MCNNNKYLDEWTAEEKTGMLIFFSEYASIDIRFVPPEKQQYFSFVKSLDAGINMYPKRSLCQEFSSSKIEKKRFCVQKRAYGCLWFYQKKLGRILKAL